MKQLQEAYAVIGQELEAKNWMLGPLSPWPTARPRLRFSIANADVPFAATQRTLTAYLDRLMARAS